MRGRGEAGAVEGSWCLTGRCRSVAWPPRGMPARHGSTGAAVARAGARGGINREASRAGFG